MASFNSFPSSSSSSSVPTGRSKYDVFLSFRGDDTRHNFTDHLYTALLQKGIRAFKDDQELHRGKPISPDLLKATEDSRFAVVVFSRNYANSSWCLEELVKIMESQALRVLPVFYHVDPSDLRELKGNFAMAFEQHIQKFGGEMDKVNKWKNALAAAANLSGWHIKTGNGGESAFIDKIVQEILKDTRSCGTENNLIGIDSHINALNSLLDTEAIKEVQIIGIWGMGGLGKTTISQALFKRISNRFEGHSFVKDVRENSSSKKDICALQEKILREILMARQGFMIEDPEYGAQTIRERLCNKKILLVLDDVDNVKQLEYLAATREWFGPGSKIIITTRDDHVLSNVNAKYKPSLLLMDQALELFCRHAFKRNSPPVGYEEVSNRAIQYTGGLPLALKVLGSFFRGRQLHVWESALNRLANTPYREIFETLKISFDGLDESEKKILLDIACFFKGEDEERVTKILDSFGFDPVIGMSILIEKSLITISNKKLQMHDLIQEMSWQIVRESYPNSRMWKLEDFNDFVKRNKKLKAIEAIVVPFITNEEACISGDVFESMKNLRLLDTGGNFTSSEPTFLPHELRWLLWDSYPFLSIPITNNCKLVGLNILYGRMEELWKGQKVMMHLKFINLESLEYLKKFPDVSGAPNIERLILANCNCLVEVHESLGSLKRLTYLDMNNCWKLKCLPFRLEMDSLETLCLFNCYNLVRFPEISECMVKLSNIDLGSCYRIRELPSSIRYLSSLSFLNLQRCKRLEYIPDTICELQHLKTLNLNECKKLQNWPEELGRMEKLQVLQLGLFDRMTLKFTKHPVFKGMFSLKILDLENRQIEVDNFPNDFHSLTSLEELNLSGNLELIELPASISHLSRLKHLELNDCYRLQTLHGLPSGIQVLKANKCISLKMIEDLSQEYEWLHKIWLFGCEKLVEDQENEIYLDKMLHKSFLQKCASVEHRLSIVISRSKIPRWFVEQQYGHNITLKLPPSGHSRIMGFAVCGLFYRTFYTASPVRDIQFTFENDGELISESKVDRIDASTTTMDNDVVWLSYIPIKYFQGINDNWSHINEAGNLVIKLVVFEWVVRCGAHIVYKEDVEEFKTNCVSVDDYWNIEDCVSQFHGTFYCQEKTLKNSLRSTTC